jgi:hypothetical protein
MWILVTVGAKAQQRQKNYTALFEIGFRLKMYTLIRNIRAFVADFSILPVMDIQSEI